MLSRARIAVALFSTIVAVLATGRPARAADLEVTVLAVDGAPVSDAVVMLRASGATPQPRSTITVDQMGKAFKPWVQVLRVGSQVRFANHDDITHHVYSFSPAKRFAYRLQTGEVQGPLDFDAPGVVVLGCNIHDWMVGYLFVTDAPRALTTDAAGRARFADLAAGDWTVQVWHPGLTATAAPPDQAVKLSNGESARFSLKLGAQLRETGPRRPLAGGDY